MSDNKNNDPKSERNGFGMSSSEDDEESQFGEELREHPAWTAFVQNYRPAEISESTEYLTTTQVMEILNNIIDCYGYSEKRLFHQLQEAGFKQLLPPPEGLFMWMVRPRK